MLSNQLTGANKLNTSTELLFPLTVLSLPVVNGQYAKGLLPQLSIVAEPIVGYAMLQNTTLTQARTVAGLIAQCTGLPAPGPSRADLLEFSNKLSKLSFTDTTIERLRHAFLALPIAEAEADFFVSTVLNELLYELGLNKPTRGTGSVPIVAQANSANLGILLCSPEAISRLVPDTAFTFGYEAICLALLDL
jgi:hypothetical protein